MRLGRKSDMAPLSRACRTALEKVLSDRNTRILFWCIVAEECGCMTPFANPPSARDVGLRLMQTAKDINVKLVHQAELDYQQKADEDDAWRRRCADEESKQEEF